MKHVVCRSIAAAGALLLSVASVSAQATRNADEPVQTANPVSMGEPFGVGGFAYPRQEVQAVPYARARAVQTRWEYYRSRNILHRGVAQMREDFVQSPEYLTAAAEEAAAYDQYLQVRNSALSRLQDDPTYRANVELAARLKAQIERERPDPKASPQEWAAAMQRVLSIAVQRLAYSSTASAMESAVLEADERVGSAQQRLVQAGSRTSMMRERFERDLRRNDAFAEARANLEQSRIDRLTANAFHAGVVEARNIAMDFGYYVHQWDKNKYQVAPYVPYYGQGYGYNVGIGYGTGSTAGGYSYGYRFR